MFAVSNDRSLSGSVASTEAEHGRGRDREYTVPSVAAATRILRWLVDRRATLTQIGEALALSKSTTYAILKTLQQAGLLGYDEATKQYYLGVQLLALGEAAANQLDYLATVKPLLRALASDTGLTGLIAQRI